MGIVSDTRYFPGLVDAYKGVDVLILNVVFYERHHGVDHLCIDDAIELIRAIAPKRAVLTHFGITLLKEKPYQLEKQMQNGLAMHVSLAYDGYTVHFPLGD